MKVLAEDNSNESTDEHFEVSDGEAVDDFAYEVAIVYSMHL